jgi:CO/xanthine dehydrogenase Mo-binding subunit
MAELAIVGKKAWAVGGDDILTGQARYCRDLNFPGMLVGKVLYSQHPHARITKLDVNVAREMPGVAAVLTCQDIPGENSYLYAEADQPLLVSEIVRYQGDALAILAAGDEAGAQAALQAIVVEYEPLPGVFDPLEAVKPGANRVWPDRSNVHDHLIIEHGDIEAGFAAADVVIDHTYDTPLIEHAFLEPECAVALVEADGSLVVYSPGQAPHRDRRQIARSLAVPEAMVRVIYPAIGGAFGGKDEIHVQIHAALLAQATGRPVLLERSREESIRTHVKRHPIRIRYRTGATRGGKITAVHVEAIGDTGPYVNAGAEVMSVLAATAFGPYRVPHARIEAYTVLTNNPICGAMRGFGIPQGQFANELQMDALAREVGLDPLEIRLLNGLETGDILPTGATLRQAGGMKGCLREAARMANWAGRKQVDRRPAPHQRCGWGLASIIFTVGLGRDVPDSAGAALDMAADGSVLLRTAASDMGQGAHTALAQIAAEALGVELSAVKVTRPDTHQAANAGASAGSRTTFVSGNAILEAARPIRQTLLHVAAGETGLPVELLSLRGGRLYAEDEKLSLSVADLAARAKWQNRRLHAEGFYAMEYPEPLPGGGYPYAHGSFTFATQIARVLVDIETGEVTVEEIIAVQDAGRVVNPEGALGQVEGGCAMGIGYALMEELLVEQGRTVNNSLESYLIPTAKDIPQIRARLMEFPEPYAPYGSKGIGEASLTPTAPAIANAVADAIGIPIRQIPLTAERVLAALDSGRS